MRNTDDHRLMRSAEVCKEIFIRQTRYYIYNVIRQFSPEFGAAVVPRILDSLLRWLKSIVVIQHLT